MKNIPHFWQFAFRIYKKGLTGFDGVSKGYVSMPSVGSLARKYQVSKFYLASLTLPWLLNLGLRKCHCLVKCYVLFRFTIGASLKPNL